MKAWLPCWMNESLLENGLLFLYFIYSFLFFLITDFFFQSGNTCFSAPFFHVNVHLCVLFPVCVLLHCRGDTPGLAASLWVQVKKGGSLTGVGAHVIQFMRSKELFLQGYLQLEWLRVQGTCCAEDAETIYFFLRITPAFPWSQITTLLVILDGSRRVAELQKVWEPVLPYPATRTTNNEIALFLTQYSYEIKHEDSQNPALNC